MMRLTQLALAWCAALAALPVLATSQPEPVSPARASVFQQIPAQAKRLDIVAQQGALTVKGEPLRLSAAVQIRDLENRLHLTQSLKGKYAAAVVFDNYGNAHRIWLLASK